LHNERQEILEKNISSKSRKYPYDKGNMPICFRYGGNIIEKFGLLTPFKESQVKEQKARNYDAKKKTGERTNICLRSIALIIFLTIPYTLAIVERGQVIRITCLSRCRL
jgi:hypothetical protein